jgi:hypothetical protein
MHGDTNMKLTMWNSPENIYYSVDVDCPEVSTVFVQCLQENVAIIGRMMSPVINSMFFPPHHNSPVILLVEDSRILGFDAALFGRNLLIVGETYWVHILTWRRPNETSLTYQTTRRRILEDGIFYWHRRQYIKSCCIISMLHSELQTLSLINK